MKKLFLLPLIIVLVVGFVLGGCAGPAAPTTPAPTTPAPTTPAPAPTTPEPITLKLLLGPNGLTAGTTLGTTAPWVREVEATGRVKFELLIGAAPPPLTYDTIVKGGADVTECLTAFTPGRFSALEIVQVPDVGTVCQRPAKVIWELYQQVPEVQKEFNEVKILALWGGAPSPPGMGFATIDKPVRTLEDLHGVKMGCSGEWALKLFEALGAVTVSVSSFEYPENLQKGIVDGVGLEPEQLQTLGLWEFVKYYHAVALRFSCFYLAMNMDKWNSLPADVQKILEDVALKIPDWADVHHRKAGEEGIAKLLNAGGEVITYTPEELTKWREAQKPVQQEYIAMLDGKGIDGAALMDKARSLFAQYAEALD